MACHHVGLDASVSQAVEEVYGAGEDGELVRHLFITNVVEHGLTGGAGDFPTDAALAGKDHGPFNAAGHA